MQLDKTSINICGINSYYHTIIIDRFVVVVVVVVVMVVAVIVVSHRDFFVLSTQRLSS